MLTYPLYLIHQYAGYTIFNLGYPAIDPHVLLWGTIALMLLVAYAVNRFIERRYSQPLKRLLGSAIDGWVDRMQSLLGRARSTP